MSLPFSMEQYDGATGKTARMTPISLRCCSDHFAPQRRNPRWSPLAARPRWSSSAYTPVPTPFFRFLLQAPLIRAGGQAFLLQESECPEASCRPVRGGKLVSTRPRPWPRRSPLGSPAAFPPLGKRSAWFPTASFLRSCSLSSSPRLPARVTRVSNQARCEAPMQKQDELCPSRSRHPLQQRRDSS